MTSRRDWLYGVGSGLLCASPMRAIGGEARAHSTPSEPHLPLAEYEPRSMLHVHESHVARARYPAIDIHTHLSRSAKSENGVALAAEREFGASPSKLLRVMETKNIRALVNLTGGYGDGLRTAIAKYD